MEVAFHAAASFLLDDLLHHLGDVGSCQIAQQAEREEDNGRP
jgi:hypothetical protein